MSDDDYKEIIKIIDINVDQEKKSIRITIRIEKDKNENNIETIIFYIFLNFLMILTWM